MSKFWKRICAWFEIKETRNQNTVLYEDMSPEAKQEFDILFVDFDEFMRKTNATMKNFAAAIRKEKP